MFSALKQLYLATTHWAEQLVDEADGVDDPTRQKARFYLKQINNALSPTNFVLTNPEVLKITAATNAENLVKGMRMLADDVAAGKGVLLPRQSDMAAFKLGKNLATTPGKVVFQNDLCQLIQYAQTAESVWKRPLLVVPPWINKFYVLDLTPEKSLIHWLVDQGHTVFVDLLGQSRRAPRREGLRALHDRGHPRRRSTRSRRRRASARSTPSAIASAARCSRSRSPIWPPAAKKIASHRRRSSPRRSISSSPATSRSSPMPTTSRASRRR